MKYFKDTPIQFNCPFDRGYYINTLFTKVFNKKKVLLQSHKYTGLKEDFHNIENINTVL